MIHQIRCHHCKQWLGESGEPMEIVGLFKDPRQRERVQEPRHTWRCRACGWANVFLPAMMAGPIEPNGRNDILRHKLGRDAA